jgi:hypothetical protein
MPEDERRLGHSFLVRVSPFGGPLDLFSLFAVDFRLKTTG